MTIRVSSRTIRRFEKIAHVDRRPLIFNPVSAALTTAGFHALVGDTIWFVDDVWGVVPPKLRAWLSAWRRGEQVAPISFTMRLQPKKGPHHE